MIICAAIKIKYTDSNDKEQNAVICGHRHGDCFQIIKLLDVCKTIEKIEGFIDHRNFFLDRTEAFIHAVQLGQLSQSNRWYKEDHGENELYSEDLY